MNTVNKDLIIRILTSNTVNINDLSEFIVQYTHSCLNKDITPVEINGIIQAIQMGIFDLRFAVLQAAQKINLYIMTITDKNGVLLKTHTYES